MFLWVKESMTVVYVQNRSPHKTLRNMMHEEAFTEVKPEVGHFRIFECPVYYLPYGYFVFVIGIPTYSINDSNIVCDLML